MSNVIPFPTAGGSNHHGAGGFNHHGTPGSTDLRYWWELKHGSIALPLFNGMLRDDVQYFVEKVAIEQQIFEALLPLEAYEVLLDDIPAEVCKPKGALLCCGDGSQLWVLHGKKWKHFPLTQSSTEGSS